MLISTTKLMQLNIIIEVNQSYEILIFYNVSSAIYRVWRLTRQRRALNTNWTCPWVCTEYKWWFRVCPESWAESYLSWKRINLTKLARAGPILIKYIKIYIIRCYITFSYVKIYLCDMCVFVMGTSKYIFVYTYSWFLKYQKKKMHFKSIQQYVQFQFM